MKIPFVKSSIVSVVTLLSAVTFAGSPPVAPVNSNGKGIAINGYDPVAYFRQGAPVKGMPEFQHQWMGATFQLCGSLLSIDRRHKMPSWSKK